MPNDRRSLALTARFHDELAAHTDRIARLVTRRFAALDTSDLSGSFRSFIADAGEIVGIGQQHAVNLTGGYLRALGRLEADGPVDAAPLADNAGFTADGRRVESALSATPAKVFVALGQGRPLPEALAFGRFSVARLSKTEVTDAARLELRHAMTQENPIVGWRWRSRGTCAACLAMDDGRTRRPGAPLGAHPFCECIQEPVFEGDQHVGRPTGPQRFDGFDREEQDSLLGPIADLIRRGAQWADLFVVEHPHEWRAVITAAPLELIARRANIELPKKETASNPT